MFQEHDVPENVNIISGHGNTESVNTVVLEYSKTESVAIAVMENDHTESVLTVISMHRLFGV